MTRTPDAILVFAANLREGDVVALKPDGPQRQHRRIVSVEPARPGQLRRGNTGAGSPRGRNSARSVRRPSLTPCSRQQVDRTSLALRAVSGGPATTT